MHQYVITRAAVIQGWAVRCNGETLSTHFTEGLAMADALRRAQHHAEAGERVQVFRHENNGRFTELASLEPMTPPVPAERFAGTAGTVLGGHVGRIDKRNRAVNDAGN